MNAAIPALAYCGLPVRVEHRDVGALFADWEYFKSAGFEVRDMRPRADFVDGVMGLPRLKDGFTVQWLPRLTGSPFEMRGQCPHPLPSSTPPGGAAAGVPPKLQKGAE